MPTYIGFSTINADTTESGAIKQVQFSNTRLEPKTPTKKFRLVDTQLVIRDFVNALNIPQGQKVGQPGYGTILWDFIFEPNLPATQKQIENEIRRVASQDPRLQISYVNIYPKDHGILAEVELAVTPFNEPLVIGVFFNQRTNSASIS